MIKRLAVAVVLLVLVCGGLVGFNIFRANAIAQYFASMPRPTVTISAVEVAPATWRPSVTAVGTAAAFEGVDVAGQVGGIVREIAFKANDNVAAGQLLVQIDDTLERSDLASAKSSVELNEQALQRSRALGQRGVVSSVSIENAESALTAANAQLAKIEATIGLKAIKAPFAGTIGIPKVNVGQYIQSGAAIVTLQQLDRIKINFTVPEQQVANLRIGQPGRFGLTEDKTFPGQIIGIDPKVDPATRLVSVQAALENTGRTLMPGQFVRVWIELPEEPNLIVLPQTSVVASLYGDYVFVVSEGKPDPAAKPAADGTPPAPSLIAHQVFVTTGRRTAGSIEIRTGIKAGDRVVTAGQNKLSEGTPVKVDNSVDPSKLSQASVGSAR